MKPKYRNLLFSVGTVLLATSSAHATTLYWDTDGATAGAGGATPSGIWGTLGTTWSTSPDGTAATPAYTTALTDDLFFSAGRNFGAYTIDLTSAQNAQSLTFEDGAVTISGASGNITLGGTGKITVTNGASATIGNNTSTIISGSAGLTKLGVGTLTLNGTTQNSFTGGITVNGGTLLVDFSNYALNDLLTQQALTVGNGGTFNVKGNATINSKSQTVLGLTLNAGGGIITNNPTGTQTFTLNLGAITATAAGGSLQFTRGAGTGTITTTNTNTLGILSARMVNGTNGTTATPDWAINTTPGTTNIIGSYATGSYSTMVVGATSDTLNARVTGAGITLTGAHTHNTLKLENSSGTLALGTNLLTLTGGGLLVTGNTATTISGTAAATRLTAGNGSGSYDLIVHQYNTGGLTISAVIGDNVVGGTNATNLVKAGTGNLFLTGINTYTGSTYINAGMLDFAANTPGGSGQNVFVAAGAIVKFNALTDTLLGRLANTSDEIGVFTGTTANLNFSTSPAPNAFLGNFAGNGAKFEYTSTITPGNGAYRLGYVGQSGALGITNTAPLSGANQLIIGGNRVVLVGAKTFTGDTTIRDGATLGLAGLDADVGAAKNNSLALQNSVLDLGSTTATGRIFLEAGTTAGAITGSTSSANGGTKSATFGGLTGSRNLNAAFLFTAPGNNTSSTIAANITGFTLNVGTGITATYSGAIGGFGAGASGGTGGYSTLTKTGAGTQILAGANTYGGDTTITNGTLSFANQLAAQRSTVTMNGGTAVFDSSVVGNAFTFGGLAASTSGAGYDLALQNNAGSPAAITLTVGGNNASTTYAGVLSAAGGLTKAGSGTLTLTGGNNYTGGTTVNAGVLALAVNSGSLSASSALTMGGGTLQLTGTGTQTLNGLTTTAGTSSRILLAANETLTLGGLTSAGAGSLLNFNTAAGGANATTTTVGTSIVTLTGQTAGTAINSGFTVSDIGGFGLATVDGSNNVVRLTTGNTLLPATGATSATDYFVDNNAGGSAADGSSSLIITPSSQAAKSITVDTTAANGVLTLDTGVVLSTNIWNFGGAGSNTYGITGSAGGAGVNSLAANDTIAINNYNAGNVTFTSPILANGTNAVTLNGTGTTVFAGTNTFTGQLSVQGGTLSIGTINDASASGSLGNSALSVSLGAAGTGTLQYTGANASSTKTLTMAGSSGVEVTNSGTALTLSGVIDGSGALTKSGGGTLVLTNTTTYTGTTTISAGALQIGSGGTTGLLSPSSVIINNGSLIFNRSNTMTQGTDFAFGISGSGSVTKAGSNTLYLIGTNTFTGGLIINGGTVGDNTINLSTAALNNNQITVNGTASLGVAAGFTTNGGVTINAGLLTIANNNGSTTWNGAFTGAGGIVVGKLGSGANTINLSSTGNTFTGGVDYTNDANVTVALNVNSFADSASSGAGNIRFGISGGATSTHSFNLGTGYSAPLTLANRQFNIAGANGYSAQINNNSGQAFTISSNTANAGTGTRTLTLGGTGAGISTFAGNITLGTLTTLNITKAGAGGTWILSGANSYNGTTAITGGTLIARSGSALGTGNVTVATQTGLSYNAATDTPLSIGTTLAITGGTTTTIGGSIGSTITSARINAAGNATANAANINVNIYGNTFSTTTDGTGTYTLVKGNGGTNTLSTASTLTLGTVFNNTNFTVGSLSKTPSTIDVAITQVSALSVGTFYIGGLSGATNVWAASNGTTASNFSLTSGGAAQALVPGSAASVTVDSSSFATSTVLGSDMSISGLTISDNTSNFALNADGYGLTIGGGGIDKSNTTTKTATIAANLVLGGAQTWSNSDTGNALSVSGTVTGANNLTVTGAGDTTITGRLMTGAGTLTKTGAGTLALSATNTYTGATNVDVGKLLINGNISTSSLTTVAAGATLGGNGTIGVATIDGILAPGNSIGTLTATGDVTWNANPGNAWAYELGLSAADLASANTGGTRDLLNITGVGSDFLKGTGTGFSFDFSNTGEVGYYKLVDWVGTSTFVDADFTATNLASGLTGSFIVDNTTSALYLNVAIPEPSTALLTALGVLALLRRRR